MLGRSLRRKTCPCVSAEELLGGSGPARLPTSWWCKALHLYPTRVLNINYLWSIQIIRNYSTRLQIGRVLGDVEAATFLLTNLIILLGEDSTQRIHSAKTVLRHRMEMLQHLCTIPHPALGPKVISPWLTVMPQTVQPRERYTLIKFWRYNKVNLATLAFCAALAQTQRDVDACRGFPTELTPRG